MIDAYKRKFYYESSTRIELCFAN